MRPDIDRYWKLESSIHNWDPRFKIFTLVIFAFAISSLHHLSAIVICFFFCLLLHKLSKIPFSFSLKRLAAVTTFIGPFFLIMPLTVITKAGDTIYYFRHIPYLELNVRGIFLALRIYIKAVSIVLVMIPMFGTNRFDISIKSLEKLKVPNSIVQMLLFSYRYIFVFLAEFKQMLLAMKIRKFKPSANIHTLKTYGNFLGTLLVRSFERTEEVYQAMLSRGYKGILKIPFHYRARFSDYLKSVLIFSITFFILFYDRILL